VLAVTAVLCSWSDARRAKDAYHEARVAAFDMLLDDPCPTASYTGFTKALRCLCGVQLVFWVQQHLQEAIRDMAGPHWKIGRWVPFAFDGSRFNVPRTKANQEAFGCAGRDKTGPQILLTSAWHMGTGLPWDWRCDAGTGSERAHFRSMILDLPLDALGVCDAGFVGYEVMTTAHEARRHFLIRVGANVELLTGLGDYVLERHHIVHLWPRGQRRSGHPPLTLRLIVIRDGKTPVYLVTNVLDPTLLSNAEAAAMYRRRWGVEVYHRTLKETLDARKLRSRAPAQALKELEWTVIGLQLLGLMSVAEVVADGASPGCWSSAGALRIVRDAMANRPPHEPTTLSVIEQLGQARQDGYERFSSKTSRDYPRKKQQKPPGAPKIRPATAKELRNARRYRRAVG